jgi:hypothetical protein
VSGEPGDHREAEPVHVVSEVGRLGTVDAGVDQQHGGVGGL